MLHEFYAVTLTSVYIVKDHGADGYPEARKIAMDGDSLVPVGKAIEAGAGAMLSIGRQIIAFIPEGGGITSFERQIDRVNTYWWLGQTSPVVALFTTEAEALECLKAKDRQPGDSRWRDQTRKVLALIGEEHPVFSVCHGQDTALLSA